MGWRGLFEGWHIVVLIVLVVVIFGWKRLPDAARSLGRSMRIFKSEVEEMKHDPKPSAASRDTVNGETVNHPPPTATHPPPTSAANPPPAAGAAPRTDQAHQDPIADPVQDLGTQGSADSAQDSRLT